MPVILIIGVLLSCSIDTGGMQSDNSAIYDNNILKNRNNAETRLIEYKDNDSVLALKIEQLKIINESRRKNNAPPVELDILASRVANKMCEESATNGYVSHWNTKGEKPYMRYAFSGGYDHVTENAYGEWSGDNYEISGLSMLALMNKAHNAFMAERAPANGHKMNITGISHTHVGIGVYLGGNQFRYYEEFIDRYYIFKEVPSLLKKKESDTLVLSTDGKNYLHYLVVYHEKLPTPMNILQLNKTSGYDDFTDEEYLVIPAWDLSRYRDGFTYTIPLKFTKEGLYYVQIYQSENEIKSPVTISTKGKVQASGIVIRVE